MEKNINCEFYNYTDGAQPFKGYKQTIIVLMLVFFSIFLVGSILFVVGLLKSQIMYTAFGAIAMCMGLFVFLLIFFSSRLTFSKVKLDSDMIALSSPFFKKRAFRWDEILAIDKINVEHNGRGGVALLTMQYIIMQKDNVVKYSLTEKGSDILRDRTNLAVVYTEERYKRIVTLWESNKGRLRKTGVDDNENVPSS